MILMQDAVARLSEALGGSPAAEMAASALVEADALGQSRFGIAMLDEWSPEAGAAPDCETMRSIAWIDCSASFAPLAVASATLGLAQAVSAHGVAAVFLRGVKGFGRLAPFVRHLADQGLLGIAGAEGPPFVVPYGGKHPVIGTNPFALAVGQGADRVVIDVASSAATMAEIRTAREKAAPLAEGIAVDDAGAPTTIAAEVAALLPRGGQIGSLVGLIVELLAGVAGGGREDPAGRGVFLLALNPGLGGQSVDWPARLSALRGDWVTGGGHWPKGGAVSTETMLDAAFETRLAGHLARLAGQGA